MEYLRWILLAVAVIVVLLVYLRGRARKNIHAQSPLDAANDMPSFSAGRSFEEDWVDGVGPVRVVNRSARVAPVSVPLDDDADPEPAGNVDETPEQAAAIVSAHNYWHDEPPAADGDVEAEAPATEIETVGEPDIETEQVTEATPVATRSVEHGDDQNRQRAVGKNDVIVLYVVADRGHDMRGEQILSATYAAKLEFGEMNIFHRYDDGGEILFSMASISEPGYFDIDHMHEMKTRGLSLFVQLALCEDPVSALDDMLLCAHTLASMLNGKMCDADRQLLNESVARGLRERARYYRDKKFQQQAETTGSD